MISHILQYQVKTKMTNIIKKNDIKKYFKNQNNKYVNDLVKIYFQEQHFLCTNGKNLYALPSDHHQEILSTLHFLHIKDLDNSYNRQESKKELDEKFVNFFLDDQEYEMKKEVKGRLQKQASEIVSQDQQEQPLKIGELFYIQIYFTEEFIYYDQRQNKLMLSRQKKTSFKVIEHITKNKINIYKNSNQYDYIGDIVTNELRYLISLGDEPLFMKFVDQNIFMGTYDEKCLISFNNSLFKSDKVVESQPLLNYPCRLYSIEEEKYLCFDVAKKVIGLKKEEICLQGMCIFQKKLFAIEDKMQSPLSPRKKNPQKQRKMQENDKFLIHILQNNNTHYMVHKGNSDKALLSNINKMISPFDSKLNLSDTFFPKYESTFALYRPQVTFNQSNLSQIHRSIYDNKSMDEEQPVDILMEQLTLEQVEKDQIGLKMREELLFAIELYPNNKQNVYEIFIYNTLNVKSYKDNKLEIKEIALYLDYKQSFPHNSKYVLKEYNSENATTENTKFKNILRVEFITKKMIQPYIYFQSIILNLNIYNLINKKSGSSLPKLNTIEIQEIILDFMAYIELREETNKIQLIHNLIEILELNFIDALEGLIQIIVTKFSAEKNEEDEGSDRDLTETIRVIMFLLLKILKLLPDRLIEALFSTSHKLLFVRMCEMKQMRNQLVSIRYFMFKDPSTIVLQFQSIITYLVQNKIKSFCMSICLFLGYKLMKIHNISSKMMEQLSEYLINREQDEIENEIIRIELIKLKKGERFYSEMVRLLELRKINEENLLFQDREKYLKKICYYYENIISLPFHLLYNRGCQNVMVRLTRDNKVMITNFIEDTLVKNNKFQIFQNKILSFNILQLYLHFGQGIKEEILIDQENRFQYTPHMLGVLQQNLMNYTYDVQHTQRFCLQILKCLDLLLVKYIHDLVDKQLQLGEYDEKIIIPLIRDELQTLILKKKDHQEIRKSINESNARKYSKLSKMSKKTHIKSMFKRITQRKTFRGHGSTLSKQSRLNKKIQNLRQKETSLYKKKQNFLRFFQNLQKTQSLISILDKDILWTILNKQNLSSSQKQQNLSLFQMVLKLTNILINPVSQINRQLQQLIYYKPLSPQFNQILIEFINKNFQYNFKNFILKLNQYKKQSEYEWNVLIILIDKNKLLKHFFNPFIVGLQKQIYIFLRKLYMYYTKLLTQKMETSQFRSKGVDDKHIQLDIHYQCCQNELNPFNIMKLAEKIKITYLREEILFHRDIIKTLGIIAEPNHYKYYEQYILRYQCENYNIQFLRLCQIFLFTLTEPLKQEFSNNFQYSLFKQEKQIKRLLHKITEIQNAEEKQPVIKKQNFNFLNELDDLQSQKQLKETQDKHLLEQLFKLLIQIQKRSNNQKQIINFIGFGLLVGICLKYQQNMRLKLFIINYICIGVQKQINYQSSKFIKIQNKADQLVELNEEVQEYKEMVNFIKNGNHFLRKEFQFFKNYKHYQTNSKLMIQYINALLAIVIIRRRIAKYFNLENTERVDREDSKVKSEASRSEVSRKNSGTSGLQLEFMELLRRKRSEEHGDYNMERQTYFNENNQGLEYNQIQNIEGINKLLCLQIVQNLQKTINNQEISSCLKEKLSWLQTQYNITVQNNQFNVRQQHMIILYRLKRRQQKQNEEDVLVHRNTDLFIPKNQEKANMDNNKSMNESYPQQSKLSYRLGQSDEKETKSQNMYVQINNFLSIKIQNYLVLLIELLKRNILIQQEYHHLFQKGLTEHLQHNITNSHVIYLMNLIIVYLDDEIQLYQREDEEAFNQNYEELPEEYYKKQRISKQDRNAQKYVQKCCKIQKEYLQMLFELLVTSFKIDKHEYLSYFHLIFDKLTYFNINNQVEMQHIIMRQFHQYSEIIYYIADQFKNNSPLVKDSYFLYYNLLNEPLLDEDGQDRYEIYINGKIGMKSYHILTLNFINMMRMIISVCKNLNFEFKEIFAKQTIDKESILSELIVILELCLDNMETPISDKYEVIRILIKLINNLIRGPVESNIEIAISLSYDKILRKIFSDTAYTQQNQKLQERNGLKQENQYIKSIIGIKKLIAQTLFILIPYLELSKQDIHFYETELTDSYARSKRLYSKNYSNIIMDYIDKKSKDDLPLLYFDLALNFFYCLVEIYNQKEINTIKMLQYEHIRSKEKNKEKLRFYKSLYQLYLIVKSIFRPIYTNIEIQYDGNLDEKTYEKRLHSSIYFFSSHVANVDVKVGSKIKRISFLLLKQARGMNMSIKNEFYKLIGKEERQLRLCKFMSISKYIIIRLQINKKINKIIQNFKPLEIIIKNRQLWKNVCFFDAVLLNFLFIFQDQLQHRFQQFASAARYFLTAIIYLIIVFMFLIYFVQNVPIKVKLYNIINKNSFSLSSLSIFLNDKTLGFAVFYTIGISLSFLQFRYVSVLLVDYFFRFKRLSNIVYILLRSSLKILYIILLVFQLLYITSLMQINFDDENKNCNGVSSCIQENFYIILNLRMNLKSPYTSPTFFEASTIMPRIMLNLITLSLIIGIIFIQKRKEDQKKEEQNTRIKNVCFVCGCTRNDIERMRNSNKAFFNHVEIDHNIWNYVYYLIYLKNKERKYLNSIENMIIEAWKDNDINWMPDQILN